MEREPPLSCTRSSLNGSSGFFSKVVVSWPVTGFGETEPLILISTPCPASVRYTVNGGSVIDPPDGGLPRYRKPFSSPVNAGVTSDTSPTFEVLGHSTGCSLPSPTCASVHATSPFAAAGESTTPAGSVMTASCRSAVARPSAPSVWGTFRRIW